MRLNPIGLNQTEIELPDGTLVLYSYQTPVAARIQDQTYRTSAFHSRTTLKHISQWLTRHACSAAQSRPQEFFDELTKEQQS